MPAGLRRRLGSRKLQRHFPSWDISTSAAAGELFDLHEIDTSRLSFLNFLFLFHHVCMTHEKLHQDLATTPILVCSCCLKHPPGLHLDVLFQGVQTSPCPGGLLTLDFSRVPTVHKHQDIGAPGKPHKSPEAGPAV